MTRMQIVRSFGSDVSGSQEASIVRASKSGRGLYTCSQVLFPHRQAMYLLNGD